MAAKILLIEDNDDIRENAGEILALAGYEVVLAENGRVGVELANKVIPDVVLCDIMMPELDGYGVLHVLSKNPDTANIPFIFLSAKTERADVRKGMELGADDYLTKPFDDTELLKTVETRLKKNSVRKKDYTELPNGLEEFINDAGRAMKVKDFGVGRRTKLFRKRSIVFSEGEYPAYTYHMQKGEIKTYKAHQDGKELITNIYRKGDFFGYEAIIENVDYQETAVALEDSEVVLIPRQDFLTLLYSHADVAAGFISFLCRKVTDKEQQLLNLAYSSIRQRTAHTLLDLFKGGKTDTTTAIPREEIAKLVGAATESVIRVLSEFKDEGLIETEGSKIRILDPTGVRKVVRWNVSKDSKNQII